MRTILHEIQSSPPDCQHRNYTYTSMKTVRPLLAHFVTLISPGGFREG